MRRAQKDMRQVSLSNGETVGVEHVTGFVTSVWPGRQKTTWIEVRQRDGHDRLCHALVPLPLDEHQVDEVSFAVGGADGDTVLAWTLWRSGVSGTLPGLFQAGDRAAGLRTLDPGVVGAVVFKLFAKVPAKVLAVEAELAQKLRALLETLRSRPVVAPHPGAR